MQSVELSSRRLDKVVCGSEMRLRLEAEVWDDGSIAPRVEEFVPGSLDSIQGSDKMLSSSFVAGNGSDQDV